jgi:hypothetical protein
MIETSANVPHMISRGEVYTGGPKSGKKVRIWKISFEIRSRGARISRFAIVGLRDGVVK